MSNIASRPSHLVPVMLADTNTTMPLTLRRRSLLTRAAALGAAGPTGLLGVAMLAPSPALAATTVKYVSGETYLQDYLSIIHKGIKVDYDYRLRRLRTAGGIDDHYCLTRKSGSTGTWTGVALRKSSNDASFIKNATLSNYTATFDIIDTNFQCTQFNDTGNTRKLVETGFNIPVGAKDKTAYEIPADVSTELIYEAWSYLSGGVYYLAYRYRKFGVIGGYVERTVTTVSGKVRTEMLDLFTKLLTAAKGLKTARNTLATTLAITAGGVTAGIVGKVINKEDIPIWAIALGLTGVVIANVGFANAAVAASYATELAAANLLHFCEQHLNTGAA